MVQKYKTKIITTNAAGVTHLMKAKKIDVYKGLGSLKDKNTVEIAGDKKETITGKNIIIAVGSKPKSLPSVTSKSERILNSDTILELDHIPGSLTIVGGGVIGIEFASVFARFGTKVSIVEYMPRILAAADEECSKELELQLEKQGVSFHKNASVEKISNKSSQAHVLFAGKDSKKIQIDSDYVLISVGREPLTKGIGLENTGVQLDEKGFVKVNEFMQSNEPNIYAIGDCVNTPWLAHIASKEGLIAVSHMNQKSVRPINYVHTPSCVYSEPSVAWSGLTEKEALDQGLDIKVSKFEFMRNGKASILQKSRGFVKFVCDKKYGEILGVHIIGPQATELLAEPAFAMQMEATIDDIADTIHAHPTLYESIYEAALKGVGQEIHG